MSLLVADDWLKQLTGGVRATLAKTFYIIDDWNSRGATQKEIALFKSIGRIPEQYWSLEHTCKD
jgi:hypothetical protein